MEDRLETVGPIGEVWVRVLGQDPSTPVRAGSREGLLAARVAVPYEHFEPGPKGPRFHVIDYDATRDRLGPPAELDYRRLRREVSAEPIEPAMVDDAVFRAQNAYAIAARTLAAFERALGRRVPWAFTGHQLYIVPSAFLEANAFYDRDANALLFGYFPKDADTTVYLSLSHDIVAHETTHAVLDGLRQRFLEAGLPDQGAFHEGLADIVALLLVFSMPEVVNEALGPVSSEGRVPASRTTESALQSTMLLGLAEEVGTAFDHRRAALRRSVRLRPSTTWRERPEFVEEHRRGEITRGRGGAGVPPHLGRAPRPPRWTAGHGRSGTRGRGGQQERRSPADHPHPCHRLAAAAGVRVRGLPRGHRWGRPCGGTQR